MSSNFYDADMAAKQEQMANTKDMRHQRSEIVRVLSPTQGEAILELGSGNGILVRELMSSVGSDGRVVGLDASEVLLEMARHICPDGEFLLGDAQDLPFEGGSFDAIIGAQLFCFLNDVDHALEEAHRILKPGGRIVILDTDWDTLVWRSSNPDLMSRVMAAYTAVYVDAHLPRSLPMRLVQAGFSKAATESFVVLNTGFEEDTYARQTAGFAASIMASAAQFNAKEQSEWMKDQLDLAKSGGFFFSLNRYLCSAHK